MKGLNIELLRENIVEKRKACGMTQSDVGKAFGITKQAVSNFERNPQTADVETLTKYADLYGCHPRDFFYGMQVTKKVNIMDKPYITTTELAEFLHIPQYKAVEVIKLVNEELEKQGAYVLKTKPMMAPTKLVMMKLNIERRAEYETR